MKALYTVAVVAILFSAGIGAATSHSTAARATAAASVNEAPANAQSFSGKIALLNGSLYILRDDQNDTWYHLDDQGMPARFLGKNVVVTGKLDAAANMICIRDIEPTS